MEGERSQTSTQEASARGGRWATVLIVSVGLLALASFSFLKFAGTPSFRLETCFQDVNGLRSGSRVRLAGVDIGVVRQVRAQPTNKACPGAVEMVIETPYELKIPRDSVASTATAGVLGETYVEIDVSEASGQPIQAGGQLPSKESVKFIDQAMRVIESLKQLSGEQKNRNTQPSSPQSTGKPAPRRSLSSTPR